MAAEVYGFRFKTFDLDGALVAWNDTIGVRLARHAYLKRDGAEQEPMGAEPGRFTMRIALMGPTWASNYRALVASIRQDPRGLLVHPLLGNLRVACTGISDASCEPGRAKRLLEVTLGGSRDVARMMGCSRSYVDMIRSGERRPGMRAAYAIEQLFEIRMQDWVEPTAKAGRPRRQAGATPGTDKVKP